MNKAEEFRKTAEYENELNKHFSDMLTRCELSANAGKFECVLMHDRKFGNADGNRIAELFIKNGFVVDYSDDADCIHNNYRTIIVKW